MCFSFVWEQYLPNGEEYQLLFHSGKNLFFPNNISRSLCFQETSQQLRCSLMVNRWYKQILATTNRSCSSKFGDYPFLSIDFQSRRKLVYGVWNQPKETFITFAHAVFFSQSYNKMGSISYKYYIMCLFDISVIYFYNYCLNTPFHLYLSTYQW